MTYTAANCSSTLDILKHQRRRTVFGANGLKQAAMILIGMVAACGKAPEPASTSAETRSSASVAAPPNESGQIIDDLFGEWQVAALESPKIDATSLQPGDPRRVAMLIGVRGIEAASQCVPYLFEHRRMGERRLGISGIGRPEGGCARGLVPYEEVFAGLVEGVTRIDWAGPGKVRLSGSAGSVTLRRPVSGAVANPFGHTSGFGPDLRWGHFRVVEAGGLEAPYESPIDVALGRSWIEARSGCLPFRWRFLRSSPGLTLRREQVPGSTCDRGLSAPEEALERIMPAVRSVESVAPYRVRLRGPAGSITLLRVYTARPAQR